jgi:hypothetical protein
MYTFTMRNFAWLLRRHLHAVGVQLKHPARSLVEEMRGRHVRAK